MNRTYTYNMHILHCVTYTSNMYILQYMPYTYNMDILQYVPYALTHYRMTCCIAGWPAMQP